MGSSEPRLIFPGLRRMFAYTELFGVLLPVLSRMLLLWFYSWLVDVYTLDLGLHIISKYSI